MPTKTKPRKRIDRRVRCPHGNRITPGNDGPCGCCVSEAGLDSQLDANGIPRARACAHGCVRVGALKLV